MESRWIRCKVLAGMFSNEHLVLIDVPGRGEIASLLVDASCVEADGRVDSARPVPGRLRVRAARGDGESVHVMLPVSSAELGRFVSVPETLFA